MLVTPHQTLEYVPVRNLSTVQNPDAPHWLELQAYYAENCNTPGTPIFPPMINNTYYSDCCVIVDM
jgi:hypothetical protein